MKTLQINVSDIIECPNHTGGTNLYMVNGIHLGAVGQDSIVDMSPIARRLAPYHKGSTTARVPLRMLEAGCDAGIFTHTPASA
jgi:hypothetical protein